MFPSSAIGNAPATEPKDPGTTLSVGGFFFIFLEFHLLKKQYLRMTLMQSKDTKMSNFLLYI